MCGDQAGGVRASVSRFTVSSMTNATGRQTPDHAVLAEGAKAASPALLATLASGQVR